MFKIVRTVKTNNSPKGAVASNREAIAVAEPKAPLSISQRSLLCKLVNAKSYDSKAVVMITEEQDGEAVQVPLRFDDGGLVTFGHLAEREIRLDAEGVQVGYHYPVICSLTKGEAADIISDMITFGDRPKNPKGSYRGNRQTAAKPQSAQTAKPSEDDRIARLEALVLQLAEGQFAQPAKPVVEVKPEPAKPVLVPSGYEVTIGKNGRPYLKAVTA